MSKQDITILGIESSCDDTAAAVIRNGKLLANVVAGQNVHKAYGGVVPELASRAHQQNIVPVVDQALKIAGVKKENLSSIAFTIGPGLIGSLLVGSSFAKAMSLALNIPLTEVNHMQGHVLAHFIDDGNKPPSFPFICLTVSGGHTQIVLVKDYFEMKIIGETTDDAAGEAFDKAAKIMGLPYPGGPLIDKFGKEGNEEKFKFTKPQIPDYDYSFSGLKTAFLYFIQKSIKNNSNFIEENKADICASFQKVIVDVLLDKLIRASKDLKINDIALAGGVSANSKLRAQLTETGKNLNWNVFIPKFEYCTDNAAMIAIAGYYKFLKNDFAGQNSVPSARLLF